MLYKDWLADWLTNYVKPSAKDKTYGRIKPTEDIPILSIITCSRILENMN